jgi:hypothetical protein
MPFPEKFRALIELTEGQVTVPDFVYLSYGVCAAEEDSCGWGGWIIEGATNLLRDKEVTVEADTEQRCPVCGKQVFRTEVLKRFRVEPEWSRGEIDYEVVPITFAKSKHKSSSRRKSKE